MLNGDAFVGRYVSADV